MASRLSAAIAAQDATAIGACLADDVEFRGLTPRGLRERSGADGTASLIAAWFAYSTELELVDVGGDEIGDKVHISYRFRGVEDGTAFVVEQQLYCWIEDDRITRADLVCSGFRPRAPVTQ
jgi:ketosteroid isomerase-like protein